MAGVMWVVVSPPWKSEIRSFGVPKDSKCRLCLFFYLRSITKNNVSDPKTLLWKINYLLQHGARFKLLTSPCFTKGMAAIARFTISGAPFTRNVDNLIRWFWNLWECTASQNRNTHLFVTAAQQLISSSDDNNLSGAIWADQGWNAEWLENTTRLRTLISGIGTHPPGMTLPRRAWVRLNRLRTGVERFRSCLYKWGMGRPSAALRAVFFAETFRHFLLRQIGHWNISVICLTVVVKLTVTVFISLCFQTFWPKWLLFFGHFKIISVYDRKKKQLASAAQSNRLLTLLSSTVQSIDLSMERLAWRFWMTKQSNGCSTLAPRPSAA